LKDGYILAASSPPPDVKESEGKVKAFSGKAVVAMAKPAERQGLILTPDMPRMEPDVGTVVSAGEGVELSLGDEVFVVWNHGKHMSGFDAGGYAPDCEIRMFGCAAAVGRKAVRVPWNRSILAMKDGDDIKATQGNVVIDMGNTVAQSEGGILLTDESQYRSCKGTIVSVGSMVPDEYKEGATVYYMANLMLPFKALSVGDTPKNYGVIPYEGILCEVCE